MGLNDKVLVADDQQGIRRLLEEVCSCLGYQAVTAENGREALRLMDEHEFRVALVDFHMPGMNGIETLEKIQARIPEIKCILMTGFGESEIVEETNTALVYDILPKPFDIDDLQALLEKAYKE